MRFINSRLRKIRYFSIFSFTFILSTSVSADIGFLKCRSTSEDNFRIWKFVREKEVVNFWTFNADIFYPFCSVGFSVEFSNGLLCAYKKDKKVGTVATFIDIQKPAITDILIREDTILEDPSTWVQKIESSCELILE